MISKIAILGLALFFTFVVADICNITQKQAYLSYDSISNRDDLANLFQNISQTLPKSNVNYTDKNGSIYTISSFTPHLYYNEFRQVQAYQDQYTVNVTLGQLYMSYRFDLTITHEGKTVSGWARGRALVDQYSFLKKVVIIDGALEWDPFNLSKLSFSSQWSTQYSEPKFTQDQTAIYIQLLNDYLSTAKIKQTTCNATNDLFGNSLKYHLNHEDILKNSSIIYKWDNIAFNYTNVIRDFKVNNNLTKGLQIFMLFGIEDGKQECIDLPAQFDQASYGGVQQLISMGTIKNSIIQATAQGLFDVALDKKYEVPYFQFFMGDLGNFVDYANRVPAHDPFTISCVFDKNRSDEMKISKFDEHDLYVYVPEQCKVFYKNNVIFRVVFDMSIIVRLIAQNNTLTAQIYQVGVYSDKYFPIDPNYVVTDIYVAKYAITALLKGQIGKKVFGTGWPTLTRKYPVIRVTDNYIVIFDPAQK